MRNKYPEETEKKILDVSRKLFLEKGFEETSMQDIVNNLQMTKGAIYHHFHSKEELFNRIMNDYYSDDSWFQEILENDSLTGAEKLKSVFFHELGNEEKRKMDVMSVNAFLEPKLFLKNLEVTLKEICPILEKFIMLGNEDGSLSVKNPREVSEILIVLLNVWMNPFMFSKKSTELMENTMFLKNLFESLGLPIIDDKILNYCKEYFELIQKKVV